MQYYSSLQYHLCKNNIAASSTIKNNTFPHINKPCTINVDVSSNLINKDFKLNCFNHVINNFNNNDDKMLLIILLTISLTISRLSTRMMIKLTTALTIMMIKIFLLIVTTISTL